MHPGSYSNFTWDGVKLTLLMILSVVFVMSTGTFEVKEVEGFLKLVNEKNEIKCWGSDVTYNVSAEVPDYCLSQRYSALCTEDPLFYQGCGAINSTACLGGQYNFDRDYALCGFHICKFLRRGQIAYWSGKSIEWYFDCNGVNNCENPGNEGLDEKICPELEDPFICHNSKKRISREKQCDGFVDCLSDWADDEHGCNHTYGLDCYNSWTNSPRWQVPRYVCNKNRTWSFQCKDDIDLSKELCEDQVIGWCYYRLGYANEGQIVKRNLTKNHMCTPFEPGIIGPCIDGRDQTNCTSGSSSVLTCPVETYQTTMTALGLCTGFDVCDDGLDEKCGVPEHGCKIHKHAYCDGNSDCPMGSDEGRMCNFMVSNKTTCIRRVNMGFIEPKEIPVAWLCDGMADCQNGMDEDEINWAVCGSPWTKIRCFEKGETCQEMYKCDITNSTKFVELKYLCDGIVSCDNELDVCKVSTDIPKLVTTVSSVGRTKNILHCLPGLESLQRSHAPCRVTEFTPLVPAFGVDQIEAEIPTSLLANTFCDHSFGELYVYLTCLGLCAGRKCMAEPIGPKQCVKGIPHKIYTLSKDKTRLILVKKGGSVEGTSTKFAHEEMFPCKNGNCVPFEKVCNLANDCGDDSDELECLNHFMCGSGEFIPLSSLGDNKVDCRDQSDECNPESHVRIISHTYLEASSWIIGCTASLTNSFILAKQVRAAFKSTTTIALFNAIFVCFIALGDFLVGFYLLFLSIANQVKADSYCKEKYQWLTSINCSLLGVISTLGSLLSLYSMTLLSVVRAYNLTQLSVPQAPTTKEKLKIFLTFFAMLILALLVSCIPLMPVFEDYFINGIYYGTEVPLFTGAPDMTKHQQIIDTYYHTKSGKLSWKFIRRLVTGMFTSDQALVGGRDLGFYGNDGVCLFKYFVKDTDPQRAFSAAILIANSVCFLTVLVSYGLVTAVARSLSSASNAARSNSKLQRKITIIIVTDFICWTPFATVSLLNYLELIDATSHYAFFSTIILPINSMINPLIYDRILTSRISRIFKKSKEKVKTLTILHSRSEIPYNAERNEEVELRALSKVKTLTSLALSSPSRVSQI
ncbi:hypothetical protein ACHWQZ_G010125 [Mnemiopsis leidyi]